MTRPADGRFAILIDAYLDGRADATEVAELRSLLAGPEDLRELFRTATVDALLRDRFGGGAGRVFTDRVMDNLPTATCRLRVAEGVMRRLQPAPVRWWRRSGVLLAAGIVLAVGAAVWGLMPQSAGPERTPVVVTVPTPDAAVAEVRLVTGAAAVLRDGARLDLAPGQRLETGDRLELPVDARVSCAAIALDGRMDGTVYDLLGPAQLRLGAGGGSREPALDLGCLRAEVAPQPADHPLRIRTPQAVAVIVGTRFTLTVDAQRTLLEVEAGKVRLEGAGKVELIAAGEAAVANARGIGRCGPWIDLMPKPGAKLSGYHAQSHAVWTAGEDAAGRWLRQGNIEVVNDGFKVSSAVSRKTPQLRAGIVEYEVRAEKFGSGGKVGQALAQSYLLKGQEAGRGVLSDLPLDVAMGGTRVRIMFELSPGSALRGEILLSDSHGVVRRHASEDLIRVDGISIGYIDSIGLFCDAAVAEFRGLRIRALNEP